MPEPATPVPEPVSPEPPPSPAPDPAGPSADTPPGALRELSAPAGNADLAAYDAETLARELLWRRRHGEPGPMVRLDAFGSMTPGRPGIGVELPVPEATAGGMAPVLALELRRGGEGVVDNRFGRAYYQWAFATFPGDQIDGSVCVELGCGSQNPFALSMLYLLLGARRVMAVDLEPAQDERYAAWGVAELASMMATDPRLLVGQWPVTRADVASRLEGFDMVELWEGNLRGLDADRISFARQPAERLPLADGEVDHAFSSSFLEHSSDIDAVIAELARVVRPGGWTWHLIDGHDHRIYTDPSAPLLGFLSEPADEPMVHGCNRLRPLEYIERFERHGFQSVATYPLLWMPVDDAERETFAEPWRSMPEDLLAVRGAVLSFRAGWGRSAPQPPI